MYARAARRCGLASSTSSTMSWIRSTVGAPSTVEPAMASTRTASRRASSAPKSLVAAPALAIAALMRLGSKATTRPSRLVMDSNGRPSARAAAFLLSAGGRGPPSFARWNGGGPTADAGRAADDAKDHPALPRGVQVERPGFVRGDVGRSSGSRALRHIAGFLASAASRSVLAPVHLADLVLAYRCGAAPDSHRVPSSARASRPGHQRERSLW